MQSIIHRTVKDKAHPFTAISNEIIDNNQLSAEARLVLIKMLRNIDGYYYSVESISHSTGISIGKATRAVKELQDAGYLKISKSKTTGSGAGRGFLITYEIFEQPIARISSLGDKPDNTLHEDQPIVNSVEVITAEQFNFEQFWNKYPKKVNRDKALKEFLKIPDLNTVFPDIMRALETQIKSKQWREEGGRYIPSPENYLKKSGWNGVIDNACSEEEAFKHLEDLVNATQYSNI